LDQTKSYTARGKYWGVGNLVQEDIYSRLRKINEDAAAKNAANGTVEQKIGDFGLAAWTQTLLINKVYSLTG
jgi:hypothetical protein